MDRQLTHVELLYRPGERDLAVALLTLLGCQPVDRGGHWFTSFIDPSIARDWATNVLYASEIGAEQLALERTLPPEAAMYRTAMRNEPQKSSHFGFSVATESAFLALIERVKRAADDDEDLAGRVAVDGIYRPGEPGAIAPNMCQAFVWTDVVAAGLLSLGQHIEIQWHLPANAA